MKWHSNIPQTKILHMKPLESDSVVTQLLTISDSYISSIAAQESIVFSLQEQELAFVCVQSASVLIQTSLLDCQLASGSVIALYTEDGICTVTAQENCVISILCMTGSIWYPLLQSCLIKRHRLFAQCMFYIQLFLQQFEQEEEIEHAHLSLACYQLLLTLRNFAQPLHKQKPYPIVVEAALNIIQEEYAFLEGVPDLAERVEVSVGYLTRLFQNSVGISPAKCLLQTRIVHAKIFLQNREFSVAMVAELCGFANSNYFAKVFRQEVGCSPSEYAKQYKQPKNQTPDTDLLWL